MKHTISEFITAIASGAAIYLIGLICSIVTHLDLTDRASIFLLIAMILIGIYIVAFSIIQNLPTIKDMFFRLCVILTSFFCFLVINGSLGTVLLLENWLQIKTSSGADNLSGLVIVAFLLILTMANLLIICSFAIIRAFAKLRRNLSK